MTRREFTPARRASSLIQHRRPLRRRLREMATVAAEILPIMVDGANFGRIRIDAEFSISDDSVILPASLPQLVTNLYIIFRCIVTFVVRQQSGLAKTPARALQVRFNYVPRDSPFSQMIECGNHPPKNE